MTTPACPAPQPPAVLLVGEALVDEFAEGPVAGGAPLNVARSLKALGLEAVLASRLNPADAAGQNVLRSMRHFSLAEHGLQHDDTHPTGRVSVWEDGQGSHRFEIQPNSAWDHLEAAPLLALAQTTAPALLYFGSLAQRSKGSRQAMGELLAHASASGCTRYLDLNLRAGASNAELTQHCLRHASWLKVNDEELAQLLRWFAPDFAQDLPLQGQAQALQPAVAALLRHFALERLVLTRGALGYAAFDAQAQLIAAGPAAPLPTLVDTVGAGDAFSAMLLAALLRGHSWPRALALANGMAAALCGQRGPVPAHLGFYTPWAAALEQT
ncbi:PfkB family carbohydrate kinase [Roseateles sp. BYS180W]|uniref:PfkB family carbohydrate kinase n=1 Tax=Roseateles rivi TaxID=3299028 RepID=A0ABW7FVF4_9BURK